MSFKRSITPLHIQYSYIYTWRNSPCFSPPLLAPLCFPFVSPFTYLAPSSCDRNRPPQSQVACKLTLFAPPFTHPTPPLQIPRTPTALRLTKTTSGIIRLLLSGTGSFFQWSSVPYINNCPVLPIWVKDKNISYNLFFAYQFFPLFHLSPGVGTGKIAGSGPHLSPFPGWEEGKRKPIQDFFPIMSDLFPLANHSQEGTGEFSCLGPPLSIVLAYARVGMKDIGQPLEKTLLYLS